MSEILYKLDGFEGPLDLLLFLITKHKLDIANIQISVLLEQYLEYIDGIEEQDFEYAGEFLEMAARLILIKTLSMLPKHEEAHEMKHELEGRLIEYSLCKQAASKLALCYVGDKIFVRQQAEIEIDRRYVGVHDKLELLEAYRLIFDKRRRNRPVEASVFRPIVSHRIVSVEAGIVCILKKLYNTGYCNVDEIFSGIDGKSEKIAAFLAVLELTKSGRIRLNEDNTQISFADRNKEGNDT